MGRQKNVSAHKSRNVPAALYRSVIMGDQVHNLRLNFGARDYDIENILHGDVVEGKFWDARVVLESTAGGKLIRTFEMLASQQYCTQVVGEGSDGRVWSDHAADAVAKHMSLVASGGSIINGEQP